MSSDSGVTAPPLPSLMPPTAIGDEGIKRPRILPPILLSGAAAMAEDAQCIASALSLSLRGQGKGNKRQRTRGHHESQQLFIMDLAARAEILGYVGNCFSSRSRTTSTWPALESHGKLLLKHPFDFDHLFDTHRSYMDQAAQVGALALASCEQFPSTLEQVAQLIEQQIVPSMMASSPILRQQGAAGSNVSKLLECECGTLLCWNVSPAFHRVMVRSVLLDHFSSSSFAKELSDREERLLLSNIQHMIVKMQVTSSPFSLMHIDARKRDLLPSLRCESRSRAARDST